MQEEQKEWHEKSTRERERAEPNNVVWARNFGVGERWIWIVELADGRMWRRHIDHLRRAEE